MTNIEHEIVTIAELRARKGKISQSDLAEAIGTTQTTVSNWEKDIMTISTHNLCKVCRYFGVTSSNLLGF